MTILWISQEISSRMLCQLSMGLSKSNDFFSKNMPQYKNSFTMNDIFRESIEKIGEIAP